MNVFIDSNVLFSTILFGNGVAAEAYFKAVLPPNSGMISMYVIEEIRRVISRKFPNDVWQLDLFLTEARGLRVVKTSGKPVPDAVGSDCTVPDSSNRSLLANASKLRFGS